jgi:hypothetical protein
MFEKQRREKRNSTPEAQREDEEAFILFLLSSLESLGPLGFSFSHSIKRGKIATPEAQREDEGNSIFSILISSLGSASWPLLS